MIHMPYAIRLFFCFDGEPSQPEYYLKVLVNLLARAGMLITA
jgi:hypothetical protein